MNAMQQYGFAAHNGGQGQKHIVVKWWNGRYWYFTGLTSGTTRINPRCKFRDQVEWSEQIIEAMPLDGPTASDYSRRLAVGYAQAGGQGCIISLMPYNGPATEPDEG